MSFRVFPDGTIEVDSAEEAVAIALRIRTPRRYRRRVDVVDDVSPVGDVDAEPQPEVSEDARESTPVLP